MSQQSNLIKERKFDKHIPDNVKSKIDEILKVFKSPSCPVEFIRWTLEMLVWHKANRLFIIQKMKEPHKRILLERMSNLKNLIEDKKSSEEFRYQAILECTKATRELSGLAQKDYPDCFLNFNDPYTIFEFKMMSLMKKSSNSDFLYIQNGNNEDIEGNLAVLIITEFFKQTTGESNHSAVSKIVKLVFPPRTKREGSKNRWAGTLSNKRNIQLSQKYNIQEIILEFNIMWRRAIGLK